MSAEETASPNPFIQLILDGRITRLEDLKRSYRKIVMRTHPDAAGAPDLADTFVAFSSYYEEAKQLLINTGEGSLQGDSQHKPNPRLRFYQNVERLESLDMPYAFHRNEHLAEIRQLRTQAAELFGKWNPSNKDLYRTAERQHQQIWSETPSGPYLKHALALNVRPVLHNVVAFHLTGRQVYRRQARQNIKAIMNRLEEEGYSAFRDYLSLLIQDMENGPALFD